jgi:hypothetical protein
MKGDSKEQRAARKEYLAALKVEMRMREQLDLAPGSVSEEDQGKAIQRTHEAMKGILKVFPEVRAKP